MPPGTLANGERRSVLVTKRRKVIVHIATSADGYIARSDGDLEWLTSRPAPKGFYGMNAFMRSVGTKLLGRKTYEVSLRMGAKFDSQSRSIVRSEERRVGKECRSWGSVCRERKNKSWKGRGR